MTDAPGHGHPESMGSAAIADRPTTGPLPVTVAAPSFDEVYDRWFDFVWRSCRRLGVPEGQVDDAVQDVFVVVHRRLADFEARSTLKTWLFGIALRVAKDHRRAERRRRRPAEPLRESMVESDERGPMEHAARAEAVRALHTILDGMDDERRAVFVMMELEQMSAKEVAHTVGVNVNTIYSRLRLARQSFEEGVKRLRARDAWRQR